MTRIQSALTTPCGTRIGSAQSFTIAAIAAALGKSRQSVQQTLDPIAPATVKPSKAGPATAWSFDSLPTALRLELEVRARKLGYRDTLALLSDPVTPWHPRHPLALAGQDAIDKAVKRRAVFQSFAEAKDDPAQKGALLDDAGCRAYEKVFGWRCTPNTFRAWLARVIERDRGLEDWARLEIYLDENSSRKSNPAKSVLRNQYRHADALADVIAALADPARPTADDREWLFDSAFRHLEQLLAASPCDGRQIRRSLLCFLLSAVPGLAKNADALKWTFRAKYAAWLQAGRQPSAIVDQRHIASGNFRAPAFPQDKKKIRDAAILNSGNVALAHRQLRQRGELSEAFVNYYGFDGRRDKSHVPRVVRSEITPQVEMCGPIHRGPWAAKMAGPYIPRDWSDVLPGQWFSADDITLNNYFYDYDAEGKLTIERGETLLMIDLRTDYPLHFMLIAGRYNSRHIRSLVLRTHDLHGLPLCGFYFERGVWKSRFIEGDRKTDSLHWRETERGLREHGLDLQVRHATTPRAKTIEGIIRILQDRQRNQPGYVGPNEQTIEFERAQEFIRRARAGKEHPGNGLLSMEQWRNQISADLGEYLADPQNGKMLDGLSPAEMWAQRQVLRKLPDDARYILSTHKKVIRVRQEGIVLEIGGERKLYANEQIGAFIGREVLAFYNVDCPDLLTVSDLNRQNYFSVKRISLPALSATSAQFKAVHVAIAGHRRTAKVIYGNIIHPERSAIVRDDSIDETSKELGRFHEQQTADFQREQTVVTRKLRKIQTAAAARGMIVKPTVKNADRVLEGMQREQNILAKIQATERDGALVPGPAALPEGSPVKSYILDAPPAAPSAGRYWSLWKRIETLKPGLNRHALTQRSIGHHPRVEDMSQADLAKLISVFESILRECRATTKAQP